MAQCEARVLTLLKLSANSHKSKVNFIQAILSTKELADLMKFF
jgi:hypothetical protein